MLKNVAKRSIATEVLGHLISFPVCIAPTAMHKMAHSEGEVATAKGVTVHNVSSVFTQIGFLGGIVYDIAMHSDIQVQRTVTWRLP